MKWLIYLLSGILLCAVGQPAWANVVGQDNAQVQAVADPILDSLLKGFDTGNYELYSKYFDDTLKDMVSKQKFLQTRDKIFKSIGKFESRSYLGFLRHGKATVVLWKAKFSKSPDDVLIKLVLSRRGDQVKVLGLWFQ
jgi:hypothetical protein